MGLQADIELCSVIGSQNGRDGPEGIRQLALTIFQAQTLGLPKVRVGLGSEAWPPAYSTACVGSVLHYAYSEECRGNL